MQLFYTLSTKFIFKVLKGIYKLTDDQSAHILCCSSTVHLRRLRYRQNRAACWRRIECFALLLLLKIAAEQRTNCLCVWIIYIDCRHVCGLWTFILTECFNPLLFKRTVMYITDIVQYTASYSHLGYQVYIAVISVVQTLPSCFKTLEGILNDFKAMVQLDVEGLLLRC